jgi:long-chain acyl-CoA synthetase
MNVATWVQRNGRAFSDRPGISVGRHVHATYGEWAVRARSIAGALAALPGMAPGERVALAMTNRAEYLEALFAIWHAGLFAVPINAKLHREEFRYILGHSGARIAFVSPDLAETVVPLQDDLPDLGHVVVTGDGEWRRMAGHDGIDLVPRAPDDPAWLFYTSGTTGRPKGAVLTHRSLLMASLSYFADVDWVSPRDAILHAAPLSHGSGLYALPHIAKGANNVIPGDAEVIFNFRYCTESTADSLRLRAHATALRGATSSSRTSSGRTRTTSPPCARSPGLEKPASSSFAREQPMTTGHGTTFCV